MSRMTDHDLALYRRRNGEPNFPLPPKPRKKRDNEESRMQQALIDWFDIVAMRDYKVWSHLLYAVPNAARRSEATGAILKREGLRTGAPDLVLDVPRGPYHGARIEMKTENGVVSDSQRAFHRAMVEQGYAVRVCYSCKSAMDFITGYLKEELS